jgi:hypothetical protein
MFHLKENSGHLCEIRDAYSCEYQDVYDVVSYYLVDGFGGPCFYHQLKGTTSQTLESS